MDPVAGNIIDPGTLHKYVYTKNNPVNRIDPNGTEDLFDYESLLDPAIQAVRRGPILGKAVAFRLV